MKEEMTNNTLQLKIYHGSCNCGKVRFHGKGPWRDISYCHCGQCQKMSGHHFAATSIEKKDLSFDTDEGLSWYASSDYAKRGFCRYCGSPLFFAVNDADRISILVGSLDSQDIDIKEGRHIFVKDKKNYYHILDNLAQYDEY